MPSPPSASCLRWREICFGSHPANIWHLSPIVPHYCYFQKLISASQTAFLVMDCRRMSSRPDVLLGNSPLFEYMHPLIPFHALPFSLSHSGKKGLSPSPSSLLFGSMARAWRAYYESSKCLWFYSHGIKSSLLHQNPQTNDVPSTSAFLLTFAYITPLQIVNTVLDVFAHILVEAFYVLGTLLNEAQTTSFNPFNNPCIS